MVAAVTPIPKPTTKTSLQSRPAKKGRCPIILTALIASYVEPITTALFTYVVLTSEPAFFSLPTTNEASTVSL